MVATVTDVRERRIPNWVTAGGALVGVLFAALPSGIGLGASVLGLAVGLAVTLPVYAVGALGAGDAKLLAAVGAFMGAGSLLSVMLYAGLAGGLLGLLSAARRGVLIPVLLETKNWFIHAVTLGRHGRRHTIDDPEASTIPYGVAIAAGAMVAWFIPLSLTGPA
ncbi:MAG: prepilin peptidase [Gemmatimonadota bacterium]